MRTWGNRLSPSKPERTRSLPSTETFFLVVQKQRVANLGSQGQTRYYLLPAEEEKLRRAGNYSRVAFRLIEAGRLTQTNGVSVHCQLDRHSW